MVQVSFPKESDSIFFLTATNSTFLPFTNPTTTTIVHPSNKFSISELAFDFEDAQ